MNRNLILAATFALTCTALPAAAGGFGGVALDIPHLTFPSQTETTAPDTVSRDCAPTACAQPLDK
ncbi:MAG: hypothetical protein ABNH26_04430 [Celeribacter sp.]|jgi:hypothetical protein